MKIIIPMAGNGYRFSKLGYTKPKPLIPISLFDNIPMIELVVKNLSLDGEYIFIAQEEHCEKYKLNTFLKSICPNSKVVITRGVTEGSACTVLLAKDYIDTDEPILIVNSDQHIHWDKEKFLSLIKKDLDGCIFTFNSNDANCSYVKLNEKGYVVEAVEKRLISDMATVGIYYWSRGSDFVKYATQMIAKNIRTNNEFYICPIYQEAINDGKKIKPFDVIEYWSLGTPENLKDFEKLYQIRKQ